MVEQIIKDVLKRLNTKITANEKRVTLTKFVRIHVSLLEIWPATEVMTLTVNKKKNKHFLS